MTSCPRPPGAVAWWSFDDHVWPDKNVVANRLNSGANGKRKSAKGAPLPPTVEGVVRTAIGSKDGNDWVEVPDHESIDFGTDSLTIEGWIRAREDELGVQPFIEKRGQHPISGADSGYHAYLHDGRLCFQTVAAGVPKNLESQLMIADEEWHHFAIVFDQSSGNVTFYNDGVSELLTGAVTGDLDNIAPLFLLRHRPTATNGLNGELTFYRRALLDTEIQDIFNAGCAGKGLPGLTGTYQLTKCYS